jgi:predicted Zn-dependent peptidase
VTNVTNFENRIKQMTIKDLQIAAQTMIKKDHFVRVTLIPEGEKKK